MTALWSLVVVCVLVLEVLAGADWFFIDHSGKPLLEEGSYIIGNHTLSPDGKLGAMPDVAAQGSSSHSGDSELRWERLISVLVSVPALFLVMRGIAKLGAGRRL